MTQILQPRLVETKLATRRANCVILAAVGNGAVRLVAVVDAADDAEALVAERGKIDAGTIVRIVADGFAEDDPAGRERRPTCAARRLARRCQRYILIRTEGRSSLNDRRSL